MGEPGSEEERPAGRERPPAARTYWHYPFVTVLEFLLRPQGFAVESFVKVGTLPLEIDVVVIRREQAALTSFERLGFLFRRLGRVSVLEYKGPSDEIAPDDFDRLFAYAFLYRIQAPVPRRSDIVAFTLSSRVGAKCRESLVADGMALIEEEPGVLRVSGAPFALYAVALDELPETRETAPLLPFGRLRKGAFARMLRGESLDRALAAYLVEALAARNKTGMQMISDEDLAKSLQEIEREIVQRLPPEERLRGLPPEERLRGLPPEERLRGLAPEERLRGLAPEERLRGLLPEELAAALLRLPENLRQEVERALRRGRASEP